jgi:23S rRNA A2030 N6-methylase RlmJ
MRGDKRYELAYGAEGNLADMCEDSVLMTLLIHVEQDDREIAMRDLHILAGLAKASGYVPYWQELKNNNADKHTAKK